MNKQPNRQPPQRAHRIIMVAFQDVQILDVAGPLEIFAGAEEVPDARASYDISIVAPERGPVRTSCGLELNAAWRFQDADKIFRAGIDTLMVAGGDGTQAAAKNPDLIKFVRRAAARATRVASVCTGAFILGQAGLLDGRRAATHWMHCNTLKQHFPAIDVEEDSIFVRDGNVWSSAGVTAGMDLALAMLEEDHGRDVALAVARNKVMFMMRPGGQSQYSSHLAAQQPQDTRLSKLLAWILDHVHEDLTVPNLAREAAMSERSFTRNFAKELGTTPARFVEAARVEAARRGLEQIEKPVEIVAFDCGFTNPERMRRAFHRHLGVSPSDYRERFCAPNLS
jgi:transcriptional regulator GlxA family with amidase domain